MFAPQDIILITIDCLRADFIYQMSENNVFAPNLKRILGNSLFFPYSITNGPGTRFSFQSLMMSKFPAELSGVGLPRKEGTTIAEFFRKHDYVTIGINSNGWLSAEFNYNRGFDHFFDPVVWGKKEYYWKKRTKKLLKRHKWLTRLGRKAKDIISLVDLQFTFSYQFADAVNEKLLNTLWKNKLEKRKKFIWLHYMDAHHPYYLHVESKQFYPRLKNINQKIVLNLWKRAVEDINKLSTEEKEILKIVYKSEISYLDYYINQILKKFPQSLIIITGDHGEEFGEHGKFHTPTFHNEMISVPLIIYGLGRKGQDDSLISHVDIAPFIATSLGLMADKTWSGSSNIITTKYQFACYNTEKKRYLAIMDKTHKLIMEDGTPCLLKRQTDVPANDRNKEKNLKNELTSLMDSISEEKIEITHAKISEKIKQQLRDLGYL